MYRLKFDLTKTTVDADHEIILAEREQRKGSKCRFALSKNQQ